ncbi:MAG: heterodisulfide reductase subunit A, partial [Spirochaetota bacterium]|nr:heterodisulfide reductase subunit A [Spirochaetota bacterium]
EKVKVEADLVVLAAGMEASLNGSGNGVCGVSVNPEGFISPELNQPGIYSTGVCKAPVDVTTSIQDATGVALKAIQSMRRA